MRCKSTDRRFNSFGFVAALFGIHITFFVSLPAHACQCGTLPHPKIALEQGDAVFYGEVIARVPRGFDSESPGYVPAAIFHVEKSWKGVESNFVFIDTASNFGFCAVGFWQGPMFLVYAREQGDGSLYASLCSRTRREDRYAGEDDPFKEMKDEVSVLGRPEFIFEIPEGPPSAEQSGESHFLTLVREVIASGTDLDAAYGETGVTLLQISVYNNYRQATLKLLKSGAKVNATTESFSLTPFSIAQELEFAGLASTLHYRQYRIWLFLFGALGIFAVAFSLWFLYVLVRLNHSEKEATSNKA